MDNKNIYNFFSQSLKGSAMYSSWGIVVKILVVINSIFILKYLTLYQFGVYKLAFSIYAVAGGFLLSGLNGIVLNDVSHYLAIKNRPSIRRLLYEFLLVRILLGILAWGILFFGSQIISNYYNAGVASYVRILSFLFLTDVVITFADIFFRATLKFFLAAAMPAINEISKFFIIIYFIYFSGGNLNIDRVLWATVLSTIVSSIIVIVYFLTKFHNTFFIPKADKFILFKTIRTYGKWAIAKSYFTNLPNSLRLWMIKIFISTEAVAIFSVANTLLSAAKKLIPLQPLLSIIPKQIKDLDKLADIYKRASKYFLFIFAAVGIFSYFSVPLAVKILFPKYIVSIPLFYILLITMFLQWSVLTKLIIFSIRKQKFLFFQPFLSIFSVVILNSIFLPVFSLNGVAIEYILTPLVISIVFYIYLVKKIPQMKLTFIDFFSFDVNDKIIIKQLWNGGITYIKKKNN